MKTMLDAHQINVFLVAAETLNFTQAAQQLQMSQPSVSQHIQSLEKHFNTRLFKRSGRSLILTEEGETLIPLAREMVRQSILIDETMDSMKGMVYGHLKVGCSTTPGKYILPHILAQFHQIHGEVMVSCLASSQAEVIRLLCNGEIHIAVTGTGFEFCDDVTFMPFLCDNITLIVPHNHHWAGRKVIEPEDLIGAVYILREETSACYKVIRDTLSSIGIPITKLRTCLTLGSSEAIALAVQEGLGVGFVSQTIVRRLISDKIVPIKINRLNIRRDIYIGINQRCPSTRAQDAFWDFLYQQPLPLLDDENL